LCTNVFTQIAGRLSAVSAARSSSTHHIAKNMNEFIQKRNHLCVPIVRNRSRTNGTWLCTNVFTQIAGRLSAVSAARSSSTHHIAKNMNEFIQKRNHLRVPIAQNHSRTNRTWSGLHVFMQATVLSSDILI
jgi:hypothetical protein